MPDTADIDRLKRCGVVPVVTIAALESAVPLARALLRGGLDVIEVTLRTPCAIDAICAITSEMPEMFVGVGTILSPADIDAARKAGADFLVTPATPPGLVPALQAFDGLVIPGVSTATEAVSRLDEGFAMQKLFPAELSGGAPFLKALRAPLPAIRFMPTGGVSPDNLADYLALGNVVAAGGSWLTPADLVAAGRWDDISSLARAARERVDALRPGH